MRLWNNMTGIIRQPRVASHYLAVTVLLMFSFNKSSNAQIYWDRYLFDILPASRQFSDPPASEFTESKILPSYKCFYNERIKENGIQTREKMSSENGRNKLFEILNYNKDGYIVVQREFEHEEDNPQSESVYKYSYSNFYKDVSISLEKNGILFGRIDLFFDKHNLIDSCLSFKNISGKLVINKRFACIYDSLNRISRSVLTFENEACHHVIERSSYELRQPSYLTANLLFTQKSIKSHLKRKYRSQCSRIQNDLYSYTYKLFYSAVLLRYDSARKETINLLYKDSIASISFGPNNYINFQYLQKPGGLEFCSYLFDGNWVCQYKIQLDKMSISYKEEFIERGSRVKLQTSNVNRFFFNQKGLIEQLNAIKFTYK